MRVRMIRPAYWTDADLHTRLSAEVREFYIGLWMEADDAGYVAWDVDRIGADLYPFRPLSWRRARLPKWLEMLGDHARLLECRQHVLVPSLPKHNSVPRPSYTHQRAHDRCLRQMAPHGATGGHMGPDGTSTVREEKGRGRKGIEEGRGGANGLTPEGETSEFVRKLAAAKAMA